MKVIVTGCTGLVGGALLRECVANPRITHVFALTRRVPTDGTVTSSPKVTVVLHDDFGTYPPELMAKLAGAEGCLWAIGGMSHHFPDVETCRRVSVDYTLAATKAFLAAGLGKADADGMKTCRMVFTSGKYTEWDQNKPLWMPYLTDSRRIKGQVEKGLSDMADAHATTDPAFQVWFVRPAGVWKPGAFVNRVFLGMMADGMQADRLAAAEAKILLDGYPSRLVTGGQASQLVP